MGETPTATPTVVPTLFFNVAAQLGDAQASAPYSWNFCVVAPTSGMKCGAVQTSNPVGGAPPYSFMISKGSLPNGLTLTADTGQISGTPDNSDSSNDYLFTICAVDSDKNMVCQPTALWVEPPRGKWTVSGTVSGTCSGGTKVSDSLSGNFDFSASSTLDGNGDVFYEGSYTMSGNVLALQSGSCAESATASYSCNGSTNLPVGPSQQMTAFSCGTSPSTGCAIGADSLVLLSGTSFTVLGSVTCAGSSSSSDFDTSGFLTFQYSGSP